ncbi:MAG: hypothetical protein IPF54_20090 [Draconibacterium sp.]|nr:hypothetical protein [Draconibacterium sp.]
MKKSTLVVAIISQLLLCFPATSFATSFGTNLVINGDGETRNTTGWSATGSHASAFVATPAYFGEEDQEIHGWVLELYDGSANVEATFSQTINISDIQSTVATGLVSLDFSAQAFSWYGANASYTVEELDVSDNVLNTHTSGNINLFRQDVYYNHFDPSLSNCTWTTTSIAVASLNTSTAKLRISVYGKTSNTPEDYVDFDNIQLSLSTVPSVTTTTINTYNAASATMGGNVTADNGSTVTERGVVYSTTDATPTIGETGVTQDVNGSGTGSFSESITGLSPNTTYHMRAYATNSAGTSYGDVVTFKTLTNGTFTGAVNNDWVTAGNWSDGNVPTSATDVTIPSGKTVIVAAGTSADCNNITIDAAGSLTIQSSSATNAGSLIVAGNATGNVTFESYLAETGKWHVVAAPVASQNIWDFATLADNSIAEKTGKRAATEYNESTNTWDTNYPTADTEGSFSPGTGYTVLRATPGVASYTGNINTSDVSKLLARDLYGWNALGNPYTSAINATVSADATNNLLTVNSDQLDENFAALYVWDAATSQYVTINNTESGTLAQSHIQAGQGFFIRAKDNSGLTFSVTEAMQTHQLSVPLKSGETAWPTIQLAASGKEKLSKTIVTFNRNMTIGLDVTYDAGMFKADKNFALYTKLVEDNGVDFAIQALPDNRFNELVIPLGIDAPAGTEITFSAEAMNLPTDAAVNLEDRAAKTMTQLDVAGAKYTVTITEQTKGAGNFFLHTSSATTEVSELENNLQVYTRDRAIYIKGNINSSDVIAVYGVDGKLHYRKNAEKTGLLRIDAAKMPAGVYLHQH